jgi:tripartite-type tricarboxylate transporter receptor subunit TctC
MRLLHKSRLAVLSAILACVAVPAVAQEFYRGKTIKLITGSAVGASYDSYARILSRHMPRYIPGSPRIIVQNMPSADGLVASNNLFNLAEKDGTVMGVLNRSSIVTAVTGNLQARYKAEQFNWLGTTASFEDNAYLFVIRSSLPYRSVDDLRNIREPIHVGNSGSPLIELLKQALDLKVKLVYGYGKSELDLAFERGEVDGVGIAYANLLARHPDWLDRNIARVLLQFGRIERFARFPDVPTAREAARSDEDRGLIELAEASLLFAYPFALPPGVPHDRVVLMRQAFEKTMNDPAYKQEVLKGKLDYSPRGGEAVQAIIGRIAAMPPSIIARYKDISSKSGE